MQHQAHRHPLQQGAVGAVVYEGIVEGGAPGGHRDAQGHAPQDPDAPQGEDLQGLPPRLGHADPHIEVYRRVRRGVQPQVGRGPPGQLTQAQIVAGGPRCRPAPVHEVQRPAQAIAREHMLPGGLPAFNAAEIVGKAPLQVIVGGKAAVTALSGDDTVADTVGLPQARAKAQHHSRGPRRHLGAAQGGRVFGPQAGQAGGCGHQIVHKADWTVKVIGRPGPVHIGQGHRWTLNGARDGHAGGRDGLGVQASIVLQGRPQRRRLRRGPGLHLPEGAIKAAHPGVRAADIGDQDRPRLHRAAMARPRRTPTAASRSAMVLGMGAVSTSGASAVTCTSSSMRMPTPRKRAGAASSPSGM